ncbi:MAG: mandelate racemase/muconate lactonizing enzyme family protein [Lentisphaeraceae bacterium]|nr:mandelate racemase/muconate lactonizing enzyme family protein [Lentisphaeraceae bacterium]
MNRRSFVKLSALSAAATQVVNAQGKDSLQEVIDQPVLKRELFKEPVIMKKIELLKNGQNYLIRVYAADGTYGVSVCNNMHMQYLYPLYLQRLQPFFINKDARDLDSLIEKVFLFKSNYKLQGLALWVPTACLEFAILDLLGRVAKKSFADLVGKREQAKIDIYRANNNRGRSAEASLARIVKSAKEIDAKAIKFKVGGRMSKNGDDPAGRTEKLIPMVREAFGDDFTIYADSNGSYDVENSIRIGRILEEHKVAFYEEPCPFYELEETKQIADKLTIPIAGGECESSMWRFKWLIENNALQIAQPDLFYFGGMIRSIKVARMAQSKGLDCIPHISGSGMGELYMLQFASSIPNAGAHQEFKGNNFKADFECSSDLKCKNGQIEVPTGYGMGIDISKKYLYKAKVIKR